MLLFTRCVVTVAGLVMTSAAEVEGFVHSNMFSNTTTIDTPPLPPVLSKRAAALAPSGFTLTVDPAGGMFLTVGDIRFEVMSGFSEVGPHWNNLTSSSELPAHNNASGGGGGGDGGGGWVLGPTVQGNASATSGRWVVTATAVNFTLTRVVQLDPWPHPRRVLVNDTIVSRASAPIGVSVRHIASLTAGTIGTAVVPGVLGPAYCGALSAHPECTVSVMSVNTRQFLRCECDQCNDRPSSLCMQKSRAVHCTSNRSVFMMLLGLQLRHALSRMLMRLTL